MAGQHKIAIDFFKKHDIHVHVPAGSVPKDGPSAGGDCHGRSPPWLPAAPSTPTSPLTGEVTLTGQVLPVGGIKEKVLAARRAGIHTVYLPDRNEADVDEIKPELVAGVQFAYVNHVDDVLKAVLMRRRRARPAAPAQAPEPARVRRAAKPTSAATEA